jgi:hypothetical protein
MVAVAAVVVSLVALADTRAPTWERVDSKDGIDTYRREVPGSPLLAIRGVATVNGSLLHVASVLLDTTRLTEWMDRVVEARTLVTLGPLHKIEYERASVPFPLTDREFVVESWVDIDPVNKQVILRARSTQHPLAPVGKLVRGDVISSTFALTPIDAEHTRLVAEIHTDPKGSLPKWMVNLAQKSWAYDTITGLRRQLARVTDHDNPELKSAITKAGLMP